MLQFATDKKIENKKLTTKSVARMPDFETLLDPKRGPLDRSVERVIGRAVG